VSVNSEKLNRWVKEDPEMPVTRSQLAIVFQAILDLENLTDVLFDRLAVATMFAMGPSASTTSRIVGPRDDQRRAAIHLANRELAEAAIVSLCRIDEEDGKRGGRFAGIAEQLGIDTSGPAIEELMAQSEKDRREGPDDG
jgi:hypothetical protein